MGFSNDFLNRLKMSLDVVDVISSEGVALSRSGSHYKGLCPLHGEKSASLVVYSQTQSFYCFGCGKGGDVITFLMLTHNFDYVSAVTYAAGLCGIAVEENGVDDKKHKVKSRVLDINKVIARHYYDNLYSEQGKKALEYLQVRGITDNMVRKFGIGFSKDSFNDGIDFLKSKGFYIDEIKEADIGVVGKNGKSLYDRFRNRLMFPIIDVKGNIIAFGGRSIDQNAYGPKYLNSAQTLAFDKKSTVFSINFAKDSEEEYYILTEGYMDVISLYQNGFKNAVATLGTAFTDKHAKALFKYKSQVYICYDNDKAGKNARDKAEGILKKLGFEVKIIDLQNAKDPDEFLKKYGRNRFKFLVQGSDDSTIFQFNDLKTGVDFTDNIAKIKYVRSCIYLILGISSALEVENYINEIAKLSQIDKSVILEEYKQIKLQNNRKLYKSKNNNLYKSISDSVKSDVNKDKQKALSGAIAEEHLILALIKRPELALDLKGKISRDDLVTKYNADIIMYILENTTKSTFVDLTVIANTFSDDVVSKISKIIAENNYINYVKDDLPSIIKKIKMEKLKVNSGLIKDEEGLKKYFEEIKQLKS